MQRNFFHFYSHFFTLFLFWYWKYPIVLSSVAELCITSKEHFYSFSLYPLPNNFPVCLLALVLRGTMTSHSVSLFNFFYHSHIFRDPANILLIHLFHKLKRSHLFSLHWREVIPYFHSPSPCFHVPFSVLPYNFCDGMTRTTNPFTVEVLSVGRCPLS